MIMKSPMLFVMVMTIVVVNCAPPSLVDMQPNAGNDQTIKLFKLMICQETGVGEEVTMNKSDVDQLHEEIVKQFSEESLEMIRETYCGDGSSALEKEVFNMRSHNNPNSLVVPTDTTENRPIDSTDIPCQLPLLDHVNCDLGCFLIKKHAYTHCVLYNHWQNVMLKLGLSG